MPRARAAVQRGAGPRRCLIVERHNWETGAHAHQLQFPLAAALEFFGPENVDRNITVRMFEFPDDPDPYLTKTLTVSRRYGASSTRRTNRVLEIGDIPTAFIFFEETATDGTYDLWWDIDKAIVAARIGGWHQARSNQHGRGRLWQIVAAPVPRGARTLA